MTWNGRLSAPPVSGGGGLVLPPAAGGGGGGDIPLLQHDHAPADGPGQRSRDFFGASGRDRKWHYVPADSLWTDIKKILDYKRAKVGLR